MLSNSTSAKTSDEEFKMKWKSFVTDTTNMDKVRLPDWDIDLGLEDDFTEEWFDEETGSMSTS